jgi:hypothetical protein
MPKFSFSQFNRLGSAVYPIFLHFLSVISLFSTIRHGGNKAYLDIAKGK